MGFNLENVSIIIITIVISIMGMKNHAFCYRMMLSPQAVCKGKIYQLITYGWVHADAGHLFGNMFTLYFFGSTIAYLYRYNFGILSYSLFYMLALVVSALPTVIAKRKVSNYYSLGASGAVSAVLFSFVLLAPWQMIYFFGVIPVPAVAFGVVFLIYSAYQVRRDTRVNQLAHITGALFGIAVTALEYPYAVPRFFREILHPVF